MTHRRIGTTGVVLGLAVVFPAGARGGSGAETLSSRGTQRQDSAVVNITRAFPIMGTMLVVKVWGRDTATMIRSVHAARDSVAAVDSLMSVYRPSSDLSAVNRDAGGPATRVSDRTMYVLERARMYWRLTGGRFDPTIGPLVAAWGFYGDSGRVPSDHEIDSLRALVGLERLEVDAVRSTMRLPRVGMRLDFGGIAKGYALDRARLALGDRTITGGTVDLGGNVLAFGRPPRGRRWRIGIADPRRAGTIIGVVALDSGAVATSGDSERHYVIGGIRYGHIIDPTTGRPAHGVASATAIGPRGEWSDGLSASLLLAGVRRGFELADSLTGVAAVFVLDGVDRSSTTAGTSPSRVSTLRLSRRARALFTPLAGTRRAPSVARVVRRPARPAI